MELHRHGDHRPRYAREPALAACPSFGVDSKGVLGRRPPFRLIDIAFDNGHEALSDVDDADTLQGSTANDHITLAGGSDGRYCRHTYQLLNTTKAGCPHGLRATGHDDLI